MNKLLIILVALATIFTSCHKDDDGMDNEPVEVRFDLEIKNVDGGRIANTETPDKILITVEDDLGNIVLDNSVIDLISFGDGYASDPVELLPGNYVITSFLVLNSDNIAIWAAPLEGSSKAQLVNDPLPISFSVVRDDVTNVPVEVLLVDDTSPSEFGYASFIPVFVPTFKFEMVVFEMDTVNNVLQTTTAYLSVISSADTLRQDSLIAGVNLIEVNDDLLNYVLSVTKIGFIQYRDTLTLTELKVFEKSPTSQPIEVILMPESSSTTSGIFVNSGQSLGSGTGGEVAIGDLDGDGDLDAFIGGGNGSTVWFNNGLGIFTNSGQNLPTQSGTGTALADLDGDSDLDAFVVSSSSGADRIWLNDGSGNFTANGQTLGGGTTLDVTLGDADNDGDIDAFICVAGTLTGRLITNDGSGFFSNQPFVGDQSTTAVTFFDFDDDLDLDVITASQGSNSPNQIWLNDGLGAFTESGIDLGQLSAEDQAVADFNSDGRMDVLFVSSSSALHSIALQINSSTFSVTPINGIPAASSVAAGDFDNDGDIDAVITSIGSDDVILMNDGIGNFTMSQTLVGSNNNSDVAVADLNGDAILDLFIVNKAPSSHEVYFGQ